MKNLSFWLSAFTLCFLFSCSEEENSQEIADENATVDQPNSNPLEKRYLGQNELYVEKDGKDYILEGDIRISEKDLTLEPTLEKSAGLNGNRWTDNTVFYTIAADMPSNKLEWINGAIAHWEANTNLSFQQRTDQTNYVDFISTNDNFCSSFVGMIGGRQTATVGNCSTGVMIHEIGHAIGLFHEQNRSDRDEYVKILFENITTGFERNFEKYTDRGIDGSDFTSTLDFQSIMMYFPTAFSKNGQPTITKLDGSSYEWQQQILSEGDLEGINIMYPADGNSGGTSICDGVSEWSSSNTYVLGDQVTYFNNLFELTSSGWEMLGSCNETKIVSGQKSQNSDLKYPGEI